MQAARARADQVAMGKAIAGTDAKVLRVLVDFVEVHAYGYGDGGGRLGSTMLDREQYGSLIALMAYLKELAR